MNSVSVRSNPDVNVASMQAPRADGATNGNDSPEATHAFSKLLTQASGKSNSSPKEEGSTAADGEILDNATDPAAAAPATDSQVTASATTVPEADPAAMLALLGSVNPSRELKPQELKVLPGSSQNSIPTDVQAPPRSADLPNVGGSSTDTRAIAGGTPLIPGNPLPGRDGIAPTSAGRPDVSAASGVASPIQDLPKPGDFAAVLARTAPEASKAETLESAAPLPSLNATAGGSAIAPARVETPNLPTIAVSAPVGTPHFVEETAQQVNWLVGNGIEQARINVTPNDMGPIEIRISMHNDEAMISFAVSQADTASAIEDALPRLKEMLADSGVTLGQTSVGEQSGSFGSTFEQAAAERRAATQNRLAPAGAAGSTELLPVRRPAAAGAGLVDLFA